MQAMLCSEALELAPHNTYQKVSRDWDKLSHIFEKPKIYPTPRIIFYDRNEPQIEPDFPNYTLDIFPKSVSGYEAFLAPPNLEEKVQQGLRFGCTTFYHPASHSVVVDQNIFRASGDSYLNPENTVAHETAHAATGEGGRVFLTLADFNGMTDRKHPLGEILTKGFYELDSASATGLEVYTGEFMPPIGQAYLLGDKFITKCWDNAINSIVDKEKDPNIRVRAWMTLMEYLPLIAGELLVRDYNCDIDKLLEDHPELRRVNCPANLIWNNYCLPILKGEKLN